MLKPLTPFRSTRLLTQMTTATTQAVPALHPYFVPRNTQGNLPVYTDVRNGGTRYLVLVRNVDGNVNMLAKDLANTLFEKTTPEASRLKIEIVRSRNLVISGGRWRVHVMEWLKDRGF